ncbi:hypothetical protein [Nonomuraea soli]|uniref:Histone H3/H4 n=1 Tax=Nonomuraea soli TaxID=1032476 RepID=A0A7W0CTX5_9ACTN|nr:hypothetical protein [Nonomuraea soli]MBA2897065.1 histone H3/H4 [Nonomuraea soli]
MRSDLVRAAELIVSSSRLKELQECSALLRKTRQRAEEIVTHAKRVLADAEREGDVERIMTCASQYEQARAAYCRVVNAYITLCRRINQERQELLRDCQEQPDGLVSGHA